MSVAAVSLPQDKNRSRITFGRTVRSEWIKFWSLKSTWWILSITTVVMIGFSALMALANRAAFSSCKGANASHISACPGVIDVRTTQTLNTGAIIGQIVLSILGILLITNEYSSGMIRTSLTAVPRRSPVLWAKTLVIGAVSFIVSFISSWIGLLAASPIINPDIKKYGNPAYANQFTGDALHATAGIALVTMLIVIFALGVASMLRNTGGSIGVVVGVLFVASLLLAALPWQWSNDIGQYVPNQAGASVFTLEGPSQTGLLPFTTGLITIILWAVIPLIAAHILLKARDA